MLSRFFSTSQPFHYLISMLLLAPGSMLLSYWLHDVWQWNYVWSGLFMAFSVLVIQFIILKNELTGKNSYLLYAYTMFLLAAAISIDNWFYFLGLVLMLLALRRLLSLKNGKSVLSKIFDATFLIAVMAMIFPLTIVFLLSVFVAVFLFNRGNWRHWAIPVVALLAVFMISWIIQLYTNWTTVSQFLNGDVFLIELPFLYWQPEFLVSSVIVVASIVGLLIYILKLVDIHQRVRPRFSLLVMTGIFSLVLIILFDFRYVIFLIPLVSIFMVRAVENVQHRLWKEVLFIMPALLLLVAIFIG
ncbi:hypothetical protein [Nonlabens ponticola]|uniref:Uncharacterized protein n=1 Tax=Nonlabens ponticola TaxID=2496866 RepID=A0A3S9MVD0_9FLAO|nr:hypothetical protein [Nonlabens ponticola]AZQ43110.1 hypothetical protein EJ995_02245 [Nonlabens ponticola]